MMRFIWPTNHHQVALLRAQDRQSQHRQFIHLQKEITSLASQHQRIARRALLRLMGRGWDLPASMKEMQSQWRKKDTQYPREVRG